MNIEQLMLQADRIFLSEVQEVTTEISPGKPPAVVTRFKVLEMMKGTPGDEIIVRQLGRKGSKGEIVLMTGLPRFAPGQKLVVFLGQESSLGFSNPIGIRQGVFHIIGKGDDPSRWMLVNEIRHKGLFADIEHEPTRSLASQMQVDVKSTKSSGLSLKDLRRLIKVRLGSAK